MPDGAEPLQAEVPDELAARDGAERPRAEVLDALAAQGETPLGVLGELGASAVAKALVEFPDVLAVSGERELPVSVLDEPAVQGVVSVPDEPAAPAELPVADQALDAGFVAGLRLGEVRLCSRELA